MHGTSARSSSPRSGAPPPAAVPLERPPSGHLANGTIARVKATVERERKLTAAPGFQLPHLHGEPLPVRDLSSTYHDARDLRLAAAGITLRHRRERGQGAWQLKLPHGDDRLELEFEGAARTVPAQVTRLLAAHLRGARTAAVARLRTHRAGVLVRNGDRPLAEVTVDAVAVYEGRRVARRFEEIEVELVGGDTSDLQAIVRTLRRAGAAAADQRPKLFQALDLELPTPPRPPARGAPAGEHVAAALRAQYEAIVRHHPGTRLGTDPEELHQMRVATRRMRAILRAARPLLDPEWVASLRAELGWLGGALGPVRDLDVLVEHLRADAHLLGAADERAFLVLVAAVESEREADREHMLAALDEPRFVALVNRLEAETAAPPLLPGGPSLRTLAAKEFRRLREAMRALGDEPPDAALHAARIRVKRARYSAELAERSVGKGATAVIRDCKTLQDVLGDHQDAHVAEERIRALLTPRTKPAQAIAAGRVIQRQHERRRAARAEYPAAWRALKRDARGVFL
jgi:CHAD domain-containing protein